MRLKTLITLTAAGAEPALALGLLQHEPACLWGDQSDGMGGPCLRDELLAVEDGKPRFTCGVWRRPAGALETHPCWRCKGERAVTYHVK